MMGSLNTDSRFAMIFIIFMLGALFGNFWSLMGKLPAFNILSGSNNYANIRFQHTGTSINKKIPLITNANAHHELQNNLIIGAATGMSLSTLHRFISSARASCNLCTITLIVDNQSLSSEDIRLLASVFNVILISYDGLLQIKSYETLRIASIKSLRWPVFLTYFQNLEKNGYAFDNVFLCDVVDTIFQTNVFTHMNSRGDGLYAFMEDAQMPIFKQYINALWIKTCFGEEALRDIGNNSISCSGTVLGSWSAIIAYLSKMTSQFLTRSSACLEIGGNDQGVHNFIIHKKLIPNIEIYLIPHETGFVGTVGVSQWLKRNKFGFVLNKKGEIYAVVHQLNRSPQLEMQYSRIYHTLSEDVLDKKA